MVRIDGTLPIRRAPSNTNPQPLGPSAPRLQVAKTRFDYLLVGVPEELSSEEIKHLIQEAIAPAQLYNNPAGAVFATPAGLKVTSPPCLHRPKLGYVWCFSTTTLVDLGDTSTNLPCMYLEVGTLTQLTTIIPRELWGPSTSATIQQNRDVFPHAHARQQTPSGSRAALDMHVDQ